MAWDGWLSLAGNEIVNVERTRAYAELIPGAMRSCGCECENLHLALGHAPYSTPANDDAPWYDRDVPDSQFFYGLLPLAVSGLDDSSRSVQHVELSGDGAAPIGKRRGSKEVRVRGLLVAATEAALDYGGRWLEMALDGACGGGCGPGDELCFMAYCPDTSGIGPYVRREVALRDLSANSNIHAKYHPETGEFTSFTQDAALNFPRLAPIPCDPVVYDVTLRAEVETTVTFTINTDKGVTNRETFTIEPGSKTVRISEPGIAENWMRMEMKFTLDAEVDPLLHAEFIDDSGNNFTSAEWVEVGTGRLLTEATFTEVGATGSIIVEGVIVHRRTDVNPRECGDEATRNFYDVMTVDGPSTIREFTTSRGWFREVDFILRAGKPYRYGAEKSIVTLRNGIVDDAIAGARVIKTGYTIGECEPHPRDNTDYWPTQGGVVAVFDPDCPMPPRPPIVAPPDSSCVEPTGNIISTIITIPDGIVPQWMDATPVVRLSTGANPVRRCRVRVIAAPAIPDRPQDIQPCNACGDFVIDYIPPNSTFVLDGRRQQAYIELPGDQVAPGGHLLSGPDPSRLFSWPVLTCGSAFLAVLEAQDHDFVDAELTLTNRE